MIDRPGHHEQQVRQTIQVDDEERLDRSATERDHAPLGAAAHRARQVQQRAAGVPPGRMNRRNGGSSLSRRSIICSSR